MLGTALYIIIQPNKASINIALFILNLCLYLFRRITTAAIITILLLILVGIYYILNPENNKLNKNEREKLGGTFIKLSDGYTHYKLSGEESGQLVVLVHG